MIISIIYSHNVERGSILYKQTRCTKDMKEFTIYKFRSMVGPRPERTEIVKRAVISNEYLTYVEDDGDFR
jgi:lipopolysaccharide/colanic/teichoic acid biosynthesis glycosyltransferase